MTVIIRKKSPRSPAYPLEDCLDKALKIYEKEKNYEVNVNTAAQHAGYKDGTSGASLSMIASLGYYGLTLRKGDGIIAITPDIRDYKNTPFEAEKRALLVKWLKSPPVFRELLEEDYPHGLPSDGNLRYALIKKGFIEKAAEDCVRVLKRSVEFVRYYEVAQEPNQETEQKEEGSLGAFDKLDESSATHTRAGLPKEDVASNGEYDEIPVRLSGNRKAWLRIPHPFFEKDKIRLKRQIDLILTEDEDEEDAEV